MSGSMSGLAERAVALRETFDQVFAAPVRVDVAAKQDLLAVRVGTEPFAIRLSEVTGLFVDRKIMPVPGGSAALLGIAGFRGSLVPVYSLGTLLGQSGEHPLRWLVVATAAPVALAFDAFDGHLRASADAILPQQSQAQMRGYAAEFIRTEGAVRPVLHLPSIIGAVGATELLAVAPTKE